ncbi:MAG: oligosaccharide flippase family protein [Cyanobacteriota bacterium]|mgnify:CR=1 FL=1
MTEEKKPSFLKSTLIYGIGGMLNKFLSFFLLPLFTAYLTPKDYGVTAILGTMTFVLTSIFTLGFGTSIGLSFFDTKNEFRKEESIHTALIILLLSAGLMFLFGSIFSIKFAEHFLNDKEHYNFVILSLISNFFNIIMTPLIVYYQFENKAKKYIILTNLTSVLAILTNVLFVVYFKRGVQGLLEAGVISSLLTFLIFCIDVFNNLKFKFSKNVSKVLLKQGLPMVPSFASLFVIQQSNRVFLEHFNGLESLGIYSIGYNLGMVMSIFVNAFQNTWLAFFLSYMDKKKEAEEVFGKITTYYILSLGFINTMFFIFAGSIVAFMTKDAFHSSYKIVGLAATSHFLNGLFALLLPALYFEKEVKYVTLIQIFAAVFSTITNIFLIIYFSEFGAALGLVIGTFYIVLFQYIWNLIGNPNYIKIKYEWGKIALFSMLYCIFSSVMLINRNLDKTTEIIYSFSLSTILLLLTLILLNNEDKNKLKAFVLQKLNRLKK